jgi:hypothetical protein
MMCPGAKTENSNVDSDAKATKKGGIICHIF